MYLTAFQKDIIFILSFSYNANAKCGLKRNDNEIQMQSNLLGIMCNASNNKIALL